MSLRIGVVSTTYPGESGGAWTFAAMLKEALAAYEGPHVFIDLEDLAPPEPVRTKGVLQEIPPVEDLIYLQLNADVDMVYIPWKSRAEPDTLVSRIRRGRLDILWFTFPGAHPTTIPYIATVWDLEHRKQPYFPEVSTTGWVWEDRDQIYSRLLPRAAIVVTGTQAGKDEIVRYYAVNPANVAVIPFAAPRVSMATSQSVDEIRSKYLVAGDFLLYPAQFWPHKNHVNLLHAFKILREDQNLDLRLVLTGSNKGNFAHVLQTVADLGLSDSVSMPGFVERNDLLALYAGATALVYPSFFGPDNLPPLEAFAIGCPVAAGDIEGAEDYLGGAALLFNPADPADMAAKIALLCRMPELRKTLVLRGKEIARQRTAQAYLAGLCAALDRFERFRRCWGSEYHDS